MEKNIDLLLEGRTKCAPDRMRLPSLWRWAFARERRGSGAVFRFRERIGSGSPEGCWSVLKASKAFVSTSAFEGQPNAVLEAMACGCPLVVSDIPAHREFLSAETAAIVPMAHEEFARAVLHAFSEAPDVRHALKQLDRAAGSMQRPRH